MKIKNETHFNLHLTRSVLLCDCFTTAGQSFLSSQKHCDGTCCRQTSRPTHTRSHYNLVEYQGLFFNPLNAELNPICRLLALLGAHHILHVSRIRVNFCSGANLRNRERRWMVVLTAQVFFIASGLSTGTRLPTL